MTWLPQWAQAAAPALATRLELGASYSTHSQHWKWKAQSAMHRAGADSWVCMTAKILLSLEIPASLFTFKVCTRTNPTLGSYPVSFPCFLLRCWVRPPDWTQQHHMQYQPGEYSASPKLMTFLAQGQGRTNTAGAFKVRTLCDPMKIAHVLSAEWDGSFLGRKAQNIKEVPKVI